jgi:hypothetical protein
MNFQSPATLYLLMTQNSVRKLIVSAWVSLDGIFDADTMELWFNPYHSDARGAYIKDTIGCTRKWSLGLPGGVDSRVGWANSHKRTAA